MSYLLEASSMEGWYVVKENGHYVSDAAIEGTIDEFIKIAEAIREKSSISFKRCAVQCKDDRGRYKFEMYSPRNTQGEYAVLDEGEAEELVQSIDKEALLVSHDYTSACKELEDVAEHGTEPAVLTPDQCKAVLAVLKRGA